MKSKLLVAFFIIVAAVSTLSGQTQPNLENGWKPYGSYDGSHLDTVNLMNGNLMLHAALTPDTPQRGSLHVSNALYATSKDWQVVCTTVNNSTSCAWQKGGTGVTVQVSPSLRVHRTVNNEYFYAGSFTKQAYGYTLISADASSHNVHGVAGTEDSLNEPTQFDSIDLSGYHLALSQPDPNYPTLLNHFAVTDRQGNKFEGDFGPYAAATCGRPANYMISSPSGPAPIVDDSPTGDQYCSQVGYASSVTDPNGNQMQLTGSYSVGGDSGTAFVVTDTLGKAPILSPWTSTTDYSGCVSPYSISRALLYSYRDPNGTLRNIKVCYSEFPIQTAFNMSGVAEAVTSTDPTSGLHYTPVASVVLADGSYWAFTYDNYGEVASVHLPTGGSITYTWTTIGSVTCNDASQARVSRAVQTRTLNDSQGHSSQWTYNWGTVSSGTLTNTATDPLGNDIVHTFTDAALMAGLGGGYCQFYETATTQYLGPSSANNPLQRTDTTYQALAITADVPPAGGGFSVGNVFATDVVTTVYPSGKVKKVHKDPDPAHLWQRDQGTGLRLGPEWARRFAARDGYSLSMAKSRRFRQSALP